MHPPRLHLLNLQSFFDWGYLTWNRKNTAKVEKQIFLSMKKPKKRVTAQGFLFIKGNHEAPQNLIYAHYCLDSGSEILDRGLSHIHS